MELEITDPNKLEEDIEAADQLRWQVRCPRIKAAQMLTAMLAQTVPQGKSTQNRQWFGGLSVWQHKITTY